MHIIIKLHKKGFIYKKMKTLSTYPLGQAQTLGTPPITG